MLHFIHFIIRVFLTIKQFQTEQFVMTSTADWEEKLANPDPKIKWALDVMDREGQEFEGFLGKIWTPLAACSLPLGMNFARNSSARLPLRTNIVATLATLPAFALFGYYTR